MKRILFLCTLLLLLSVMLALPVSAQATVTSVVQTCSSFAVTGSTDQPYIVVEIWSWINESQGTYIDHVYTTFPVNPDGSFNLRMNFAAQPPNTVINYWVWGAPQNNVNSWDGEDWYESGAVSCVPAPGPGPGIPSGFVLRTITCDVPVYATPAGMPVAGGAAIRAGQTWFVNPTPINGADGRQWTEIFAAGFINGYIPTACVS